MYERLSQGVNKKFSAWYALVNYIEFYFFSPLFDLSEGHLECEKNVVMLGYLCKALLREDVRHICKMEKLKIRVVIKEFCKKGMPPKEINEDFMETLGMESPSYSTVTKWAAEFERGRER